MAKTLTHTQCKCEFSWEWTKSDWFHYWWNRISEASVNRSASLPFFFSFVRCCCCSTVRHARVTQIRVVYFLRLSFCPGFMWNDRLDDGTTCSFWHATIHKDANFSWCTNKSCTKSSLFSWHGTAKSPIVRHDTSHVLSPLFANRDMVDCVPTRSIHVFRLCFVRVHVTTRPFYDPDHKRRKIIL